MDNENAAPRKRRTGMSRKLLRWHRRLGIIFSVVFLTICVTGIFLNHTEGLKLSQKTINNSWLLSWYGMTPKTSIQTYPLGDDYLSELEGELYFNGNPIGSLSGFVGVAKIQELVFATGNREALLLTSEGETVERYQGASLPNGEIQRLGRTTNGQAIILTDKGSFVADQDFLSWVQTDTESAIDYIKKIGTPNGVREIIYKNYRGDGLSLYKVILDLHSGRIFGSLGKVMADASAVILIFLTLSGLYYSFFLRRK